MEGEMNLNRKDTPVKQAQNGFHWVNKGHKEIFN